MCSCPLPPPQRLQQQTALPGAIFDYTPLRLNLQETGVFIQGDALFQEITPVSLIGTERRAPFFQCLSTNQEN